jgi:3alpha(or 20beta)-hydroxysteroid dehydrogenase
MGRLDGKVAIITGAAQGQGAAEAKRFVAEGAKVLLGDVLDDKGKALAESLGSAALYCHLDVSSESDWKKAIDEVAKLGKLNVLVNNAAILRPASIEDTSFDAYKAVIDINQHGCFLGMKAALAPMREAGGGSIVNVSSIDGIGSKNGLISYTASKFAIRGMTKTAAIEWGQYGIRVNSVHPGGVNTPMGNPINTAALINQAFYKFPIPRMAEPEEIGNMVLFLASDEASYCTGAEFVVDGGWTCGDMEAGLPGSPLPPIGGGYNA